MVNTHDDAFGTK